jgi:hypothetical protein
MKRLLLSLALGAVAGVVDVIPMFALGTSWHARVSAFVHWVVLGFVITHVQLGTPGWVKGLLVALLSAVPIAVVVAETDPAALLPMAVMSSALGSAVGYLSGRMAPAALEPEGTAGAR